MPGFDGTGPRGMGPMTGSGRGFCSPWGIGAAPGGFGIFPRVGYGYPFYGVPMTLEQELAFLKSQAGIMRSQLEQIEARMRELEAKGK